MRVIIRNLDEMSDSREFMEAKSHPFISIFIAILAIVLVGALIWSYFGEIDIVTKANGVVKPNHKISTISNKVAGTVTSVNFKAGQMVKKGELLLTMDYGNLEADKQLLTKELELNNQDLENLLAFKQVMLKQSYKSTANSEGKSSKFQLELDKIEMDIQKTKTKVGNMKRFGQSIEQGRNLFPVSSEYYYKYKEYAIKKQQLELEEKKGQELFKEIVKSDEQGEEDAKRKLVETKLQSESYLNDLMLKIRSETKQGEYDLQQLKIQRDKLYTQLNEEIEAGESNIKDLMNRISTLEVSMNERELRAPIDGVINILSETNIGDFLLAGTTLMTIVPENNSEYIVQLALQNRDIAAFQLGDEVEYSFQALPFKEYGHAMGTVQSISADATTNQESGVSYYLVESSINGSSLFGKSGEEKKVKVGMTAEAHIITERQKILFWLLNKINLRN